MPPFGVRQQRGRRWVGPEALRRPFNWPPPGGNGTGRPSVLVVVGDPAALTATDKGISERLNALGFGVDWIDDAAAVPALGNYQFVVVAESCNGATLGTKYTAVALPVLVLDNTPALNMDLVGDTLNLTTETSIDVIDTSHPAAGGQSGTVAVFSSAVALRYGTIAATGNGHRAYLSPVASPTLAVGLTYEQGGALLAGHIAEGRRGVLYLFFETYGAVQLAAAWAFFDALVAWAISVPVIATTGAQRIDDASDEWDATDDTGQTYAIQPPAAVAFDPASGFPWQQDRGETFVADDCYPDPTTDLANVFGPPAERRFPFNIPDEAFAPTGIDETDQAWAVQPPAAAPFNPATGFPWGVSDDERFVGSQLVDEPDSAIAFGFPPYDPAAGFPWNADDGERFVSSVLVGEDWQAWAIQPPAVATVTQLTAFAVEGGEVQQQPGTDPSEQSWAVGPPQNAVQALAFNQPDEAREVPVEDPTGQTYPIQPPPYTPVFQTTAWSGDPENWQQAPGDDPSVQAWAVQPPLNATQALAFNEPEQYAAPIVSDDTGQPYALQPPAAGPFDPSTVPWTGRDDIVQPVWAIADDTSQAWAIGPLPFNPATGFPFNRAEESPLPAWMLEDITVGVWTATFGAVVTVTGGFPPGGSAAAGIPVGAASGHVPRGTAGGPVPAGEASNPKPGA